MGSDLDCTIYNLSIFELVLKVVNKKKIQLVRITYKFGIIV